MPYLIVYAYREKEVELPFAATAPSYLHDLGQQLDNGKITGV